MAGHCRRSADIDFPAFLIEPHDATWEEFRHHYSQCPDCTAEVARWARLEWALRTMDQSNAAGHPSEEQLAQFQRCPHLLSAEARHRIEQHLKGCPACKEEMTFVDSFDFSLLQEGPNVAKAATSQPVKVAAPTPRASFGMRIESIITGLFDTLRSLVLHPAFAYAVVLVLCIPAVRYYQLLDSLGETDSIRSLSPVKKPALLPSAEGIPVSGSPEAIARTLLDEYRRAYEARDIEALGQVWEIPPDQYEELQRFFAETRVLSLLLDVESVQVTDSGLLVEFRQIVQRLGADNRLYRDRTFGSYVAELRKRDDTNRWVIAELQALPG
jgi:hypothetical protein